MRVTEGLFRPRFYTGKPTEAWGRLTLFLGLFTLIPVLSPLLAVATCIAGTLGTFLASKSPERFAGRRKIMAGLVLSAAGMALFFVEADLFFRYKIRQERDQRMAISRFRMGEIQDALERYREAEGVYPKGSGAMTLCGMLDPRYTNGCQPLDGFDRPFSVASWPQGYILSFHPPPAPGQPAPPPVILENRFLPAPVPEESQVQGPPIPPGLVRPDVPPAQEGKEPESGRGGSGENGGQTTGKGTASQSPGP